MVIGQPSTPPTPTSTRFPAKVSPRWKQMVSPAAIWPAAKAVLTWPMVAQGGCSSVPVFPSFPPNRGSAMKKVVNRCRDSSGSTSNRYGATRDSLRRRKEETRYHDTRPEGNGIDALSLEWRSPPRNDNLRFLFL